MRYSTTSSPFIFLCPIRKNAGTGMGTCRLDRLQTPRSCFPLEQLVDEKRQLESVIVVRR
jgi:hypothetical protein